MTQAALKRALKEVLVETMRENRHLLADAMVEAVEQVALTKAIREGKKTARVSRARVMRALKVSR